MPEFRRVVVLSTGHVTPATRTWLEHLDWIKEGPAGGPCPAPYGWTIYAHDDNICFPSAPHAPFGEYPTDLWACFEYARAHGADYVMLDADGPREGNLAWYDSLEVT